MQSLKIFIRNFHQTINLSELCIVFAITIFVESTKATVGYSQIENYDLSIGLLWFKIILRDEGEGKIG